MIIILGTKKKTRIFGTKASIRDWIHVTQAVMEHVGNHATNRQMHTYLTRMHPFWERCVRLNERLLDEEENK